MSVQLNHTIVSARDPQASATFLAEMLGLAAPVRFGPFHGVEVDNGVTLDFLRDDGEIVIQHYAFLVSEDEFDEIFGRIEARGLMYWADPAHHQPGVINHGEGGRGVYWDDPDGHRLEILTRPYGGGGARQAMASKTAADVLVGTPIDGPAAPTDESRAPARTTRTLLAAALAGAALIAGCSGVQLGPQATVPASAEIRRVAPQQAERLYSIMVPLLRAMDDPLTAKQVRVGIMDDEAINAANAGGGNFYVTTGLLQKASEQQLRGIMAHEIAHEDLGHVAQMQVLGAGLNVGVQVLEQLVPGSSAITPIAGELIARGYSRSEETEADRHAVELLRRAGYSKETLIEALSWVARASGGGGGGGFMSTHPAMSERIEALKE